MKTAERKKNFDAEIPSSSDLKIGEVSKISGIGIEALRFYERSGLLQKPLRSSGGYRIYDGGILQRLDFIKKAQTLGFSLDEIRRIINDAQSGASPCSEVRKIVGLRLAELDGRMREMKRYRKELAATLDEWNKIGRAPGNICGLIEASDIEKPPSIKTEIAPKRNRQSQKED